MEQRKMTREEWKRLVALKPFVHYTVEEKTFLINMARTFIDPNISAGCSVCGNTAVKLKLYGWFNEKKDLIDAELKTIETLNEVELAKKQTEDYTNETDK